MTNAQPGWYPDPVGDPTKLRYWDGAQWTNDFTDAVQAQPQVVIQETVYTNPDGSQTKVDQVYYPQATDAANSTDKTLRLIAFIMCVISTVSVGWALLPLIWMIPMTVHCWGIYQGTKQNSTAFAVCTLIFLSLIAGILLLVSKKEK